MARKKASAGASSRWRELLGSARGRWLVRVAGTAVVLLAVGVVVRAARAQAYSMPGYRLTSASLTIEGLPSWMDGRTRELFAPRNLIRTTGRFSVSIYDPEAEGLIAERVERHPLVARTTLVHLRYPHDATVRVQLREPVASIAFGGAQGEALVHLLAADHTLLPVAPYRALLERRRRPLPVITGIGLRPPVRRSGDGWQILVGRRWEDGEDDRVEEAVAAALTAARIEEDLGGRVWVRSVDVSRFTRTGRLRSDERRAEVQFEVVSPPERPGGPRAVRTVLWGRTSRAAHEVVGEDGFTRKLARLRAQLLRPNAPAVLEARWDT